MPFERRQKRQKHYYKCYHDYLKTRSYEWNFPRIIILIRVGIFLPCVIENIWLETNVWLQDADLDILDSDEDEIDEDSAVYLESLQDKLNKHVNGNMQVSQWPSRQDRGQG